MSVVGDEFTLIALPWLTLQLTGSGLALGTVFLAAALPRALLMLVGGALTDRLSPRLILLGSHIALALLVGGFASLVLASKIELWHIYLFSTAFGTADAFYRPALLSIVPRLVDEEQLQAGNALIHGSVMGATLIVPVIAGLVVAVFDTGVALAIDAVSFAVAAAMLSLVRKPPPGVGSVHANAQPPQTIASAIAAGFRYAWRDPVIRPLLLIIASVDLALVGSLQVGSASLASERFDGHVIALGAMLSGHGAGALLGIIIAGSVGQLRRRGLLVLLVATITGLSVLLLACAPNVPAAVALVGVAGLALGFANVLIPSWVQSRVSSEMMGRVMSLIRFATVGGSPFSFLLAGFLVDVNVAIMFACAGGLILVATAVAARSTMLHAD